MNHNHSVIVPAERMDNRIHVAIPIRVTCWDQENKPCLDLACTYDISSHGARVTGLRLVKQPGAVILVERGLNKAFCRVVWIGDPNSERRGQIGIQCVEPGRKLWEAELHGLAEVYEKVQGGSASARATVGQNGNRRRQPRFEVEGVAELVQRDLSAQNVPVVLKNLSETGCLISAGQMLVKGTEVNLVLKIANYNLALRGQVQRADLESGLGIEFREIRKGDRPMLQYLLRKLAQKPLAAHAAAGR